MRMLIIQLTQTYRHLSAARTRSCHHYQRTGCLDIIIQTKALRRSYQIHIMRIAVNDIMIINLYALSLQTLAVCISRTLSGIVGNDYRRYTKATFGKLFAQTQHVFIIGNTQVLTHLITLDIFRRKDDDNLHGVLQLRKHTQLTIGQETRQNTTRMHIIEEFTA